jgi:DNA-binding CsgD family transcriptional regulator
MPRRISRRRVRRYQLTDRELQVLVAYCESGTATYEATAAALELSPGYVADVLAKVRERTGSANTAQAVYRLRHHLDRAPAAQQPPRENTV